MADILHGLNLLTLIKGNPGEEEHYLFLFDDDNRKEVMRTFGRFAANPELRFSWYDAAVLARRVRDGVGLAAQEDGR